MSQHPPPTWFPSWLTQNYLIDAARYVAAGVKGQDGAAANDEDDE